MLYKSVAVAGLLGLAQARSHHLAKKDLIIEECAAAGGYVQVIISTNVVAYPVVINQYFADNTIIIINGGVTINIDNAPTTLSTTVTATTTTTVTSVLGPAIQTPIVIQIQGALAKRQGASYLGAGGVIVGSCGTAAEFTTDAAGQLFSNGMQVSTDVGSTEQLIAVNSVVGSITSAFSGAGGISWTNGNFTNGAATFCAKGNLLYAEFTDVIPVGCNPMVLSALSASSCAALNNNGTKTTVAVASSTPFSNGTLPSA